MLEVLSLGAKVHVLGGYDGLGLPFFWVVGVEPECGVDPDGEATLKVVVAIVVAGKLQIVSSLGAGLKFGQSI